MTENRTGRKSDRVAVILQAATAIGVVIALIVSLVGFAGELSHKASKNEIALIQTQRYNSAVDSCNALRSVVFTAYTPKYHAQALALIHKVHLDTCTSYANHVVQPVTGGK